MGSSEGSLGIGVGGSGRRVGMVIGMMMGMAVGCFDAVAGRASRYRGLLVWAYAWLIVVGR